MGIHPYDLISPQLLQIKPYWWLEFQRMHIQGNKHSVHNTYQSDPLTLYEKVYFRDYHNNFFKRLIRSSLVFTYLPVAVIVLPRTAHWYISFRACYWFTCFFSLWGSMKSSEHCFPGRLSLHRRISKYNGKLVSKLSPDNIS